MIGAAAPIGRLLRLIHLPRRSIVLVPMLLAARSLLALIMPWPLKIVVDNVINQKRLWPWLSPLLPDPLAHRMELLVVIGIVMLALAAAENVLSYQSERMLLVSGQRAVFQLRARLFAHVQRLSLSFHRRRKGGELMARLGGDIQTLQDFIIGTGSGIFLHLTTVLGIIAILFLVDWRYAVVILFIVLPLLWLAQIYTRRIKVILRRARQKEGEVWGLAQETLGAIQIVQAYGREGTEEARFRDRVDESLFLSLAAGSLQLQLPRLVGFVLAFAATFTVCLGAVEVVRGNLSTGELLVGLAYLRGLATPVRQLAKLVTAIGKAEVAAERIAELLTESAEVREAPNAHVPDTCRGGVEFRSVSFAFEDGREVLNTVSFQSEKGKTLALVGASGAGKSTIASLILRFHDPTHGQVLLDGIDIRELSLPFLRGNIAYVTQEPILLSGPVWENIAYGRLDADRNDAIRAAKAAGVHEMIMRLPAGYDTMVGERGATLSGGQRQVISFARAMLRDAPIVVLDEPTSSLDAATEVRLIEGLKRLAAGRAMIVIAHRLHTIMDADTILVLDQGRVVDAGTHDDLLRRGGHYAELWRHRRDLAGSVFAAR